MRLLLLLPLAFLGCKPNGGGDDSSADADADADTDVDPDLAPFVVTVDRVECTGQQSAGETWDSQLTVDDPQGADTVRAGDYHVLNSDGGELATGQLACGAGQCFGTWRADLTGVTCAMEGDVTVRFYVEDEDGNRSNPTDYQTQ